MELPPTTLKEIRGHLAAIDTTLAKVRHLLAEPGSPPPLPAVDGTTFRFTPADGTKPLVPMTDAQRDQLVEMAKRRGAVGLTWLQPIQLAVSRENGKEIWGHLLALPVQEAPGGAEPEAAPRPSGGGHGA